MSTSMENVNAEVYDPFYWGIDEAEVEQARRNTYGLPQ